MFYLFPAYLCFQSGVGFWSSLWCGNSIEKWSITRLWFCHLRKVSSDLRKRNIFFRFSRQSDAIRAIQSMDGQLINGRSMQVRIKRLQCFHLYCSDSSRFIKRMWNKNPYWNPTCWSNHLIDHYLVAVVAVKAMEWIEWITVKSMARTAELCVCETVNRVCRYLFLLSLNCTVMKISLFFPWWKDEELLFYSMLT